MTDPVVTFRNALPAHARRALVIDPRVYKALHTIAERGDNIVDLARRVHTKDLVNRKNSEVDRLIRHRVMKHAGTLEDQEMTD